jgi:hypothetical protein
MQSTGQIVSFQDKLNRDLNFNNSKAPVHRHFMLHVHIEYSLIENESKMHVYLGWCYLCTHNICCMEFPQIPQYHAKAYLACKITCVIRCIQNSPSHTYMSIGTKKIEIQRDV